MVEYILPSTAKALLELFFHSICIYLSPHITLSSGVWLSLFMSVCCLWRHTVMSNSRFRSNVLEKFFGTMHIIINALSLFIVV